MKTNNILKSFILLGAVVLLSTTSACKKTYTCECTVLGNSTSETWESIKSSEAKDSCNAANSAAESYGGSCTLK